MGKVDIDNNDNVSSISFPSALTTMDWRLIFHPDCQQDYWIGESEASSHVVGEDKDLSQRLSFQRKQSMLMVHQCPWCAKEKQMWKQFLNRARQANES